MIKERQDKICKVCAHYPSCGYISRGLQRKCTIIQNYDDGYDMGWEDAVNRACEWWAACNGAIIGMPPTTVENFRKAMEEDL